MEKKKTPRLTRRQFLKAGAAGLGAVALGSSPKRSSARRPRRSREPSSRSCREPTLSPPARSSTRSRPRNGARPTASRWRRLPELAGPAAEDRGGHAGWRRRHRRVVAVVEPPVQGQPGGHDGGGRGVRQARRRLREVRPELGARERPVARHPPRDVERLDGVPDRVVQGRRGGRTPRTATRST